jgi:hypothetical protein
LSLKTGQPGKRHHQRAQPDAQHGWSGNQAVNTVYVWTRVTSGEPSFAPRPIEAAQPPEVQEGWRRSWDVIWRNLRHTSDPRSHYTRFRAELDAFAAALAKTIDTAGHT